MRTTGDTAAASVSIVLPVRDGDRFLAEAIASVLAQDVEHLELVVVDDGSSDESRAVAAEFVPRVRLLEQPPTGVASALNRGVEASEGALLGFIDADDRWPVGKLRLQRELLAREPELDAVFGHAVHFTTSRAGDEVSQAPVPAYSRGTMLIRRAAFDRVGPFSPEWRLGEFIDWWARAVDARVTSVMLDDTLLLRRVHDANLGVVRRDEQAEYARVLKAVLDRRRARP